MAWETWANIGEGSTNSLAYDHNRNMQDPKIRDNHNEHPSNLAFIPHHEMQSRIQHQRLSSHHAPPTQANDDASNVGIRPYFEVQHDKA